jgi:diguanylate cyclase
MTIYCVLIKIVSTIFGANLSLKPFWVLIMTYVKNHFSPTMQNYIVMADIDYFKHINDTYGHLNGDGILKQLADVFKNVAAQMTGVNILIGRYGGEEFIFFIEMEKNKDIQSIVAAFQDKVRKTSFYLEDTNEKIDLTLSFGVCPIENINDLTHSTGKADKCLYRSKNNGRNQISYA